MDCNERSTSIADKNPQSRNIVICCDGTGNEFGDENSNVVKLYATLDINQDQIGYYHPGVGTMGAPNARGKLAKQWTRVKGLAFGAGLIANVGDAYRYLMDMYRDGDRIFLFGFSRGAYTARALAGVLHTCGLLCPGNEGLIPYALRIFARKSRNAPSGTRTLGVVQRFKDVFSRDVLVDFVGIWDTVSSVGWIYDPVVLPDEGRNPIVKVSRHAVSIDERRCFYRDKLWGRPFEKNDSEYRVAQDIKQVWFAGVHSDVGGSYPEQESGLSKLSLEWMLHEASTFGLKIDLDRANAILGRSQPQTQEPLYVSPDPAAELHKSLKGLWRLLEFFPHEYYNKPDGRREWRIPLGKRRAIPEGSLIHESVLQRIDSRDDYCPRNLPKQYGVERRVEFPALAVSHVNHSAHAANAREDQEFAHIK